MKTDKFEDATKELHPLAEDIIKHAPDLLSKVDPSKIVFLFSKENKQTLYAYVKLVTEPYNVLDPSKDFFVIVIQHKWVTLNEKEKRYVLLHELFHCMYDEKGIPKLRKHTLENFEELVKDPAWNLDLV